ncbi:hypothetical protein GNX18_04015 [Microbulbifer sp. SH-1]|uniref:hypothetical protein n=1 Tax=Microbulbifer sp. SH-1 TaxID=2681547 RepID=UPI001409CBA5|nr:hypothetical protein [Microbulbifer sp. SH-1]QIL89019.1 hypothetical protein GNX18_04015 [Microbulbifer sp. SH-1]
MSAQQKFQIVSAGKTLRAKSPAEVLQQMASAFSIKTEQARKLFVKGWVIKDQLTPAQVVQYRTQLQQIGLKIEVHPAGKFDNRAILARLQFARQRKAKLNPEVAETAPVAALPAGLVDTSSADTKKAGGSLSSQDLPANRPRVQVSREELPGGDTGAMASARAQLEALFLPESAPEVNVNTGRLAILPGMFGAALVPALFCLMFGLCVYYAGLTLWAIPAAILEGSFGFATMGGVLVKLVLLGVFAALLPIPYFFPVVSPVDGVAGERLRKQEAPGLFLLLEILQQKVGLGITGRLAGPRNLSAASATTGALVEVTPGAEIRVRKDTAGQPRLSLGLAAVASLKASDVLALIARSMCGFHGRWSRLAGELALTPVQRLQQMQEAMEQELTLLSAGAGTAKILQPLHRLLASCGLALVPVTDRLLRLHRAASGPLARRLETRADCAAAQIIGSDGFADFAERWNQLLHADLVCGEINREAQLVGKRLANVPQAVRWLRANLDEQTRASIEMSMGETTDCWSPAEPAGHERIAAVEERGFNPLLARGDFSFPKLFLDFDGLCIRVSRVGADDSCRAVENHLLLTASREVEEAQQTLTEYFNRVIPREFLPNSGPANAELAELDLQQTIDWLRARLVDLQELEQRHGQLQLHGARIQLGAALVRANVRIDPRKYHLTGTTPAAADETRKHNRVRIQESQQQRGQIHAMFLQRIRKTVVGMDTPERNTAGALLAKLALFEQLREPLCALERTGDLVCEMIEQHAVGELPAALLQKYPPLAVQQIRQVYQVATHNEGLLSDDLLQKLAACGEGEVVITGHSRSGELISQLQALELRCKHASAVVHEGYQLLLARLLGLCLAEEKRRNIKPLRLAAVI